MPSSPLRKHPIPPPPPPSLAYILAEDNRNLRVAGCKLAEAAIHVAREYDGIHRLMLAVAGWATAVANEGGRPHDTNTNEEPEIPQADPDTW